MNATNLNTLPLVTTVIPAYNVDWCILRAVESALAQTYKHQEIIVVNDGSTDTTLDALSIFNNSIKVLTKPNGGLSSARNHGILHAKGEFIAFLDADDYWLPKKLECQIALFHSQPNLGFCSTETQVKDPDGIDLGLWECPLIEESALKAIFMAHATVAGSGSSVVARRSLFDSTGLFDETLQSLEDIDMWMQLAAISNYACIVEPLSVIIKRPDSMSRNLNVMRSSAIHIMKKNRHLLKANSRYRFWQTAYASMLSDYAKWEYRNSRKITAILHLLEAFLRAPLTKGRLTLGLLIAMLKNDEI